MKKLRAGLWPASLFIPVEGRLEAGGHLVREADPGVWTFWRDGRWAVSRTIFHRAGDAPRG
ncbi:MAG TPA: hypothetical protein VGL91_17305, partial [Acidobacteriota bacterium]